MEHTRRRLAGSTGGRGWLTFGSPLVRHCWNGHQLAFGGSLPWWQFSTWGPIASPPQ